MRSQILYSVCLLLSVVMWIPAAHGQENAAKRGRKALETRAFTSAGWSLRAYDTVWKYWDNVPKTKPDNYQQAFLDYYGLHPAPFENGKLPMGLRVGQGLFGKGISTDCMICHGGSIMGKSYIGLPNTTSDIQALVSDMGRATGTGGKTPFAFSNVRGTTEAAAFAVFLSSMRKPDLTIQLSRQNWDLCDDLCEDPPAWWLLKKKKTMYMTGSNDSRSVRSIMQFMLGSLNGPKKFHQEEATFRDIQAFLKNLEAPKYPFAIDKKMVHKGKLLFEKKCSTCHGTYGNDWTYPNKIIPLDVIGTDPKRANGLPREWGEWYNKSWFAKEKRPDGGIGFPAKSPAGYQAPPLDGIWATAPYLHNASVPTLYHVLNSSARPTLFTRSFKTDESAYDKKNVGWKITNADAGELQKMSAYEQRKIYDTRQPGRRNVGHTFGDAFTEEERRAVMEYLKTL